MQVVGVENMTPEHLQQELSRGARFVYFEYTISLIVVTFKRPTNVYYVPAGESAVLKGLGYSLMTFLLGWWGIPWGPIYSVMALATNFRGGEDVTAEVVAGLRGPGYHRQFPG